MILKPVDGNDYSHKHVLTVDDIKDILEIGQNKAYELVQGDYFPTKKLDDCILSLRKLFSNG